MSSMSTATAARQHHRRHFALYEQAIGSVTKDESSTTFTACCMTPSTADMLQTCGRCSPAYLRRPPESDSSSWSRPAAHWPIYT